MLQERQEAVSLNNVLEISIVLFMSFLPVILMHIFSNPNIV